MENEKMNNKSITKLLETVAFSNGVYVLWNLYDGNIHISIRVEMRNWQKIFYAGWGRAKIDREQTNELEYADESQKEENSDRQPVRNPEREKPK